MISVESVYLSVYVSVCVSVYISVCVSIPLKVETSFLVHTYILTIFGSSLSIKIKVTVKLITF